MFSPAGEKRSTMNYTHFYILRFSSCFSEIKSCINEAFIRIRQYY